MLIPLLIAAAAAFYKAAPWIKEDNPVEEKIEEVKDGIKKTPS